MEESEPALRRPPLLSIDKAPLSSIKGLIVVASIWQGDDGGGETQHRPNAQASPPPPFAAFECLFAASRKCEIARMSADGVGRSIAASYEGVRSNTVKR